jgi:hypothetical protein
LGLLYRVTAVSAAAVAAAAFALPASAGGAKASFEPRGCYPGNEFTTDDDFGAFFSKSQGSASDGTGSVAWTFHQQVSGNRGTAPWSHTPGAMGGSLTAVFHLTGIGHTVTFTSHCITQATLRYYDGEAYAIAAFEGAVDLPPWNPGNHDAVVYLELTAVG